MSGDIISIDRDKCTGCGSCVGACAQGAIAMVEGKAMLVREDHCDGLGECLPACPAGAITVSKRTEGQPVMQSHHGGDIPLRCPSVAPMRIEHGDESATEKAPSRLGQWPIQLCLVNADSSFFDDCDLLISGDCCSYALGSYHEDFIKGRVCLINCPKFNPPDNWKNLDRILLQHKVKSITLTRMEVPCCGAAVKRVEESIRLSCRNVSLHTFIIHMDGSVSEQT